MSHDATVAINPPLIFDFGDAANAWHTDTDRSSAERERIVAEFSAYCGQYGATNTRLSAFQMDVSKWILQQRVSPFLFETYSATEMNFPTAPFL